MQTSTGDVLYISIDTTGYDALHKRGYRVYDHPAALNAALASAMLLESGWSEDKSLLDPFAGGGTIPIEAALYARRIPWFRFRSFLFEKSGIVPKDVTERVRGDLLAEVTEGKKINAKGIEKFEKHVKGAWKNARSAGVADTVVFEKGDATRLGEYGDVVVTNPPYGNRIANPRVVYDLYHDFAERAADVGIPTVTTITSRWKWMEDALREVGYRIEKSKFVLYGKLHTHLIRVVLE